MFLKGNGGINVSKIIYNRMRVKTKLSRLSLTIVLSNIKDIACKYKIHVACQNFLTVLRRLLNIYDANQWPNF